MYPVPQGVRVLDSGTVHIFLHEPPNGNLRGSFELELVMGIGTSWFGEFALVLQRKKPTELKRITASEKQEGNGL